MRIGRKTVSLRNVKISRNDETTPISVPALGGIAGSGRRVRPACQHALRQDRIPYRHARQRAPAHLGLHAQGPRQGPDNHFPDALRYGTLRRGTVSRQFRKRLHAQLRRPRLHHRPAGRPGPLHERGRVHARASRGLRQRGRDDGQLRYGGLAGEEHSRQQRPCGFRGMLLPGILRPDGRFERASGREGRFAAGPRYGLVHGRRRAPQRRADAERRRAVPQFDEHARWTRADRQDAAARADDLARRTHVLPHGAPHAG